MFKAMAKLNLAASVVKHRRAGSGAGGSRQGSAEDLSRAFEETTSVSSSPNLADVPRSLEEWAEQDSEDFDADAFAAEHYGDAGESRVARLHAVLGALQEQAGEQMKQNVLDHHSAFVEVAREISRLTDTVRALRDLAAVPSDAVDALLADAEADAADAKRRSREKKNAPEKKAFAYADDETRRGPDGVRVSDAAEAARLAEELETLVARRAPHAALDAAKRAAFFAETLRASVASYRAAESTSPSGDADAASERDLRDPAAARALLAAAASARRAATAMLAEIARSPAQGSGGVGVGVPFVPEPGSRFANVRSLERREEDDCDKNVDSRRAASILVLSKTDASGADSARRACVARAVVLASAARRDAENAERAFSIENLSRFAKLPGYALGGFAFALNACETFFGAAHALAAELASVDDADTSASSATARLWSATSATSPFAKDEADAFADALAARCLAYPPDAPNGRLKKKNAAGDEDARRALAESRTALEVFFAHADAFAETSPAFLGVCVRRRVCDRATVKQCMEKLLFETTAANALDARAEDLLRAYLGCAGDEAADALRAFAVLR
jgi:hypothetical protein